MFLNIKQIFLNLIILIKIICARSICSIYKRKEIWLISERENDARDNGYFLYKYIVENHPEVNIYYAINPTSHDFIKIKGLGNWVKFGSLKHHIMYLSSSVVISTQMSIGKPGNRISSYLEKKGFIKVKKAFLQHGVIQNTPSFCLYSNSLVNLFVCGAKDEFNFVRDNFGYPDGVVQHLGLCRFDNLHDFKTTKNQILIMPTWRNWLYNNEQEFIKSDYYKSFYELINNIELLEMLENMDMDIVFYLHNDFQKYASLFISECKRIIIAKKEEYDVQQLLKESRLLITDYSSVFFDFAYMKKPIIYYQFDHSAFFSRQYEAGYFDYKDHGFGPVCYNNLDVLKEIRKHIDNEFALEEVYEKRIKSFFSIYDDKNCERNFKAIKELIDRMD